MFDSISWGELVVVVGLGLTIIGKQDLPRAARMAGTQVGRVVGLLQGARARADRFAAKNELRQLQQELQSGLRELDMVKSELAVSMSGSRGISSRPMGSLMTQQQATKPMSTAFNTTSVVGKSSFVASSVASDTLHKTGDLSLPPASQSIAAVAEEEWSKQGISFKSRAELGAGMGAGYDVSTSGSVLLANMIQQSLIFDQYDRVVAEQDQVLESKIMKRQQQTYEEKTATEEDKQKSTVYPAKTMARRDADE
jgi:Sec-independent protein translocase protein TatA